jgi:hypothetical protein
MYIDQQILVIDGELNAVAFFERRQFLGHAYSHGNKSGRHLAGIDSCLFASNFVYRAEKNPVAGKRVIVSVVGTGCPVTERDRQQPGDREDCEMYESIASHVSLPFVLHRSYSQGFVSFTDSNRKARGLLEPPAF